MYKIYVFFIFICYLLFSFFYKSKNNVTNLKKNNNKNKTFIENIIEDHTFFLNKKQKKIIIKNILEKKKINTYFFDLIDEMYLGKEIFYNENISVYYLIGKAFMTSYLENTPNCYRIVNKSHEKSKNGYVYTFNESQSISNVDKLKIISSGIFFHNISIDSKLIIPEDDLIFLNKYSSIYKLDDIIYSIYSIIYKNKKKMIRFADILKNNKSLLYTLL